ncbi:hypothetical protein [Arenivirga flava]|uniref:Uncharacterized protein n=1 Tax=Arenivirga flava TaxID=1930060 RepID=A0AA37USG7_9MICO|nr:hypothetical protein [Arenivirga flava]GMA29481.1 hypothetical protein GCM10025874_27340 [Arenivirga flava]
MTGIPSVLQLNREDAIAADVVSAYLLDDGPQQGMTVVEIFDAHQVVLGRTITDAVGPREQVADAVLDRSELERCSEYAVEPLGQRKRVTASVIVRVSPRRSAYETEREAGGYGVAG